AEGGGGDEEEGGDAAKDDGEGRAEKGADDAGFEFAELGAADEENHIDRGHASAQVVGGEELANGGAKNCADGIARADEHEKEDGQVKVLGETKADGCQAIDADGDEKHQAFGFDVADDGNDGSRNDRAQRIGGGEDAETFRADL